MDKLTFTKQTYFSSKKTNIGMVIYKYINKTTPQKHHVICLTFLPFSAHIMIRSVVSSTTCCNCDLSITFFNVQYHIVFRVKFQIQTCLLSDLPGAYKEAEELTIHVSNKSCTRVC